jgi:hypothetical protein
MRPLIDGLHHFVDKLIKVEDSMKTSAAKKMAKERTVFLLEFGAQFQKEANLSFLFDDEDRPDQGSAQDDLDVD